MEAEDNVLRQTGKTNCKTLQNLALHCNNVTGIHNGNLECFLGNGNVVKYVDDKN